MKHFVFHLISIILLIVLFLITLDLTRAKQISQKEIDELTKQCTAAEQTLEKERAEKAKETAAAAESAEAAKQLAEKERAENAAKTAKIEAEKKDLQEKLAILEESVAEMGRRFQVVSARDVKMLGLTFEQTPRSDADAATAVTLADSVKEATPAAFKTAAESMLAPRIAAPRELVLDAESGYVVDPLAAIVETAAKAANLSASTTVFWDVSRKIFRSEVAVSDPAKNAPSAVVALGGNSKTFRDAAFQLSPKTTVFPFTDISLLSRNGVDLFSRTASIPVGGLYVHYFRVYSKGPWVLEYVFPDDIEPEAVNMNLLPLTPGSSITSTVSGKIFTFQVDARDSGTDFLVVADKPFFPVQAAIRLK
ncbi:MAG: hypothetical protein IKP09_03375 [Lentisphaeria bacterium]|nr:hypothetical protein [Lentisphaeria bacterium]